MKAKPNTDQFKTKQDPAAFLEGGSADVADRTVKAKTGGLVQPVVNVKIHREQKIFRLPLDLINALKREAYERSISTGNRVTETELVEEALRRMIDI
jgi:hypothetical protein